MRKQFLFLFLAIIITNVIQGQVKSTKIGYIDMEYILQNVTNYTEAQNLLEQKAQKWKQEIEVKKIEINKISEALKIEKPLLTKELIEERATEIKFLEKELVEYQQRRFGANGDLIQQKLVLAKPIQDQVFATVQDIAEAKQYDFIFDKSSDLTMLFAAKRFDISDQVLRVINRSEKREQLTKKQQKELEEKERKEDNLTENPGQLDKQKALDAKKEEREKIIAERKQLQEAKKKEIEDKRKKLAEEKQLKKNSTTSVNTVTEKVTADNSSKEKLLAAETARKKQVEEKQLLLEERKRNIEDNKKIEEEKRNKAIEERKKIIENNKKAAEEKRNKIIEEKAAAKKAAEEKLKPNTNKN